MSNFERYSEESERGRDVPSFIEARPPLVTGPGQRPRPYHATNLMEVFESESVLEDDVVQVYLRMKPCGHPNILYNIRSDTLLVTTGDAAPIDYGRRTQSNISQHRFSHIFGESSTQKQIFDHVVKDNLRKLLEGHSYTLLTYGASGSGKTYTLMGTENEPGLIPRSLEYMFKLVSPAQHPEYRPRDGIYETLTSAQQAQELGLVSRLRKVAQQARSARRVYRRMSQRLSGDFRSIDNLNQRTTHYVWVSFVEIYNEAVYDLLVCTDRSRCTTQPATKLKICEDPNGTAYVKGATQAFVRTGAEAYDVMAAGRQNLHVASTGVHAHSSRSHCIFTISLLSRTSGGVVSTYVRLCDLAGSERADRTQNAGMRMTESRAINSSLHVLERCLRMLRRKQRAQNNMDVNAVNMRVPFRESKLTRLLGAPLSGVSHEAVSLVVTVNPSPLYAQETRHVLKLVAVASSICVNPVVVDSASLESLDHSFERDVELVALRADNERLQFEIDRLYAQLETHDHDVRSQSAVTMRELVNEAKDNTAQYYTRQMALLQTRHDREIERLKAETDERINKLIVENTKLKEDLKQRPLEMAVVESELEHLHTCLAERDLADTENTSLHLGSVRAVIISDDSDSYSESDSDDDISVVMVPSDDVLDNIREENSSLSSGQSTVDEKSFDEGTDVGAGGDADNVQVMTKEESLTSFSDEDDNCDSDDEIEINLITNSGVGMETETSEINTTKIESKHDSMHNFATTIANLQDIEALSNRDCNESEKYIYQEDNTDHNIKITSLEQSTIYENKKYEEDVDTIDNEQKDTIKQDDIHDTDYLQQFHKQSEMASDVIELIGPVVNKQRNVTYEKDVENNKGEEKTSCKSTTTLQRRDTVLLDKPIIFVPNRCTQGDSIDPNTEIGKTQKSFTLDSISFTGIMDNANSNKPEINPKSLFNNPVDIVLTEHKFNNNTSKTTTDNFDCIKVTEKSLGDTIDFLSQFKVITSKTNYEEKFDESINNKFEKDIIENALPINDSYTGIGILSMCRPKSECIEFQDGGNSIKFECRNTFSINNELVSKHNSSTLDLEPKCHDNSCSIEEKIGECEHNRKNTTLPYNTPIAAMKILTSQVCDVDLNMYENESSKLDKENYDKMESYTTENRHIEKSPSCENYEIYLHREPKFSLSKDLSTVIGNFNFHSKPKEASTADESSNVEQSSIIKNNHSLKLRKKHAISNDNNIDKDKVVAERTRKSKKESRLCDMVNLQHQFSDVALGVPSAKKVVSDKASPEKQVGEENLLPTTAMTCPALSTRNRRKLYTPRAEPLDESVASDDDGNLRVRVPRPSYHRGTRARRKL